jgi:hypothetical protein
LFNRFDNKMNQMVFGYPFPQILGKQQGGIPVYIDKSRTHEVMVSDFIGFDDPWGEKRNRLLGRMSILYYLGAFGCQTHWRQNSKFGLLNTAIALYQRLFQIGD